MASELTDKQIRFCNEYLVDLNATQAAIRAGYSPATADQQASRLLTNVKVQELVRDLRERLAEKTQLNTAWVINRFKEISDRCMQAEPVMIKNEEGELVESGEYKFDSAGANKATEMIGKHLGSFERDNSQRKPDAIPFSDSQVDKIIEALRSR